MNRLAQSVLVFLAGVLLIPAQEEGKILRPVDGAAVAAGPLSIVAGAPGGRLELDGEPLAAEEKFPGVFEAKVEPPPGEHVLTLSWEGGRKQIRFWAGPNPPAGYAAFQVHPPVAVECTQCHGLSRRGRFRFSGGCFDCHRQETFVDTHQHPVHVFEQQCGACHNAHGSTQKAHFVRPRQEACGLCHTPPEN